MLLRAAANEDREQMERHIFTEIIAVQMLLMSTLEPLLCGEKLTQDEVGTRFRQVQKTKAAHAQELLVRRIEKQEK